MPFEVQRLGVVMQAEPGALDECGGVLNPGAARGRDGALYLYPRLKDDSGRSRIGLARVRFDAQGEPADVERIGYAVEPTEPYETLPPGEGSGCEDARVTYVDPLDLYVMAYAAAGPQGPHVALAVSGDGLSWRKNGLARFDPGAAEGRGVNLNACADKDAALFPGSVRGPDGREALALLHRPFRSGLGGPRGVDGRPPGIWVSYCALDAARGDVQELTRLGQHHALIEPRYDWEDLWIGTGAPPVRTQLGWLLLYHGVTQGCAGGDLPTLCYSAGAVVLDERDPRRVLYHSEAPVLAPHTPEEWEGIAPATVFPTGVDVRGEGCLDVYYGMADTRIGVARLSVPSRLPV